MTIRTFDFATGEVSERELTAEEIAALPAPVPPTPREQLAVLETTYTLTQRNLREFILLTVEALKMGVPVDLSVLPGVQVVTAVEAEAAVLRAQIE
jgi:hypothetical protein